MATEPRPGERRELWYIDHEQDAWDLDSYLMAWRADLGRWVWTRWADHDDPSALWIEDNRNVTIYETEREARRALLRHLRDQAREQVARLCELEGNGDARR